MNGVLPENATLADSEAQLKPDPVKSERAVQAAYPSRPGWRRAGIGNRVTLTNLA